jgi:hypothetical protein
MTTLTETPRANWGFAGFLFGVAALAAAVLLVSGAFNAPPQSVGTSIGQLAAEIRQAAKLALNGSSIPSPETVAWDANAYLGILAPILAAIGVILGGVSLFRHEPSQLPKLAIGFGLAAFLMQYVFWLAVLICGVILLTSIISNLGSILGE